MKNNKKIALITGASQGIGKAIALRLAQEGIPLFLASRSFQKLKKLQREIFIKYGNKKIEIYPINLEKKINNHIFKFCKKKLGLPNILINNSEDLSQKIS